MPATTRLDLRKLTDELFHDAWLVLERKNADYAGADDPLRNLRNSDILGIPPDLAVLVRILDKIGRLRALTYAKPKVVDETIRDTVIDVINYMVLYYALRSERR